MTVVVGWVRCGGCGEVGEVWRRWVGLAGPLPADSGEGKLSRPPSHLASYIPQHLGGFPVPFFLYPGPLTLFPVPCSLFPVPWLPDSPFPVP